MMSKLAAIIGMATATAGIGRRKFSELSSEEKEKIRRQEEEQEEKRREFRARYPKEDELKVRTRTEIRRLRKERE